VRGSAPRRGPLDRPLDHGTGGEAEGGRLGRPGDDPGATAKPRPQAVAGNNVVPRDA
jgi:hypothetical protein